MNLETLSPFTDEQIAEYRALAARVMTSPPFRSSPKLRELLEYVIDGALKDMPSAVTEQQIGIHVFNRRPGYNSGDDSIVRSQMRLLRMKLASYFEQEGASEPTHILIPKGHYIPSFITPSATELPPSPIVEVGSKTVLPTSPNTTPHETSSDSEPASPPRKNDARWKFAFVAALFLAVGTLAGYAWHSRSAPASPPNPFWQPFFHDDSSVVIFSNPVFIGDLQHGFHLKTDEDRPQDSSTHEDDTYTGTGEAMAIKTITRIFDAHHADFTLKRSKLVTWDEARLHNLIFVGAPSQNGALSDLKTLNQFQIALNTDQNGFIRNLHQQPGEPSEFPPISDQNEMAIVALMPGLSPGTHIAVFSGLSTLGTQAAMEFMSHPENVEAIATHAGLEGDEVRPFEAVLNIVVRKEVPISVNLVLVHPHTTTP